MVHRERDHGEAGSLKWVRDLWGSAPWEKIYIRMSWSTTNDVNFSVTIFILLIRKCKVHNWNNFARWRSQSEGLHKQSYVYDTKTCIIDIIGFVRGMQWVECGCEGQVKIVWTCFVDWSIIKTPYSIYPWKYLVWDCKDINLKKLMNKSF